MFSNMLEELDSLLSKYEKEIQIASENGILADNTAKTYLLHSRNFVKWCHGEFVPGGRNALKNKK